MSKQLEQLSKQLAQHRIDLQRAIDDDLPRLLGNRVAQLTRQNFHSEGFFGNRWKEVVRRKHPRHTRSGGLSAASRRPILTSTGNLGRSIDFRAGKATVDIYSDVPYAAYHNEGTNKLPRRQFLGDHPRLRNEVKRMVENRIREIMRKV